MTLCGRLEGVSTRALQDKLTQCAARLARRNKDDVPIASDNIKAMQSVAGCIRDRDKRAPVSLPWRARLNPMIVL